MREKCWLWTSRHAGYDRTRFVPVMPRIVTLRRCRRRVDPILLRSMKGFVSVAATCWNCDRCAQNHRGSRLVREVATAKGLAMRSLSVPVSMLGILIAVAGCQTPQSSMHRCSSCGQFHGYAATGYQSPTTVATTVGSASVPSMPAAAEVVIPVSSGATVVPQGIPPIPTVAE